MVLAVIYSWNHWEEPKNPKAFLILMLILATGMNGTFVALDLVLFFIFFEVVLLPMYFMIGIWGDKSPRKVPGFTKVFETRLYASIKFFLFTLFGSAFMLLGFLALYFESGKHGERTFDIVQLTELGAARSFRRDASPSWCSGRCSSGSRSRSRCGPSTPGSPTPTPPPRRWARCCWQPSC